MIKAIIFDMDGVLIDSEPFYMDIILKCMREFHIPVCLQDLIPLAGANSQLYTQIITPILEGYVTKEVFDQRNDQYFKHHPIDFTKLLFPQVREILPALKSKGYRIALASSSKKHEIENVLKQCQLTEYFEFILSGDMFKESKPNPEIYLTCIDKLGLSAEECVAIEDSEYGITAAKGANLTCIARTDTRFGYNQSAADYAVNNLLEILDILENIRR